MKKLSLIIALTSIYFAGYASGLTGKCTPTIAGSGFTGTTTYCAGVSATALTYNYAECSSGTGTATGVACTATWYYNTTNTTIISGATVQVSGPTAFTSAAGVNGNLPTVTPSTATAGTYYYFCVVSWVITGTCTSPFTTTTQAITINPLPGAIVGNVAVCAGATINLSSALAGGTWSSSSVADATVGSATGIVTGVVSSKPTITYTLSTGCKSTAIITVNPIPAAITGTTSVCAGLTTTLADGTAGGTWSSSNATVGTVSTTKIVTGITAGTTTISYSLATGCYQTTTVTVNQSPAAITGSSPVCVASTISLSNAIAGGTWSSSSVADATVGSTTGIVTGVISAKPTITYLLADGCKVTNIVTVNPLPAAITGTTSVCTGLTTTLADGTAGGTWSSSNAAAGTVSTTKIVTGIAAGTTTISYSLATGCYQTTTVSVNQSPAAITGSSPVCVASTISLSNAIAGGTWSSSSVADATVGSTTGIVTGVISAKPTITYLLADGCKVTNIVTVNPLPAAITGTASVCTGLTTTLADVTAGGTWSSSDATVATIGTTRIVTGITAGTTTISYSLATGCYKTTTVTVNQNPAAITGSSPVCVGSTISLSNTITGGTWSSSSVADATVGSATGIVGGVVSSKPTITYTFSNGCKSTVIVTVNPIPVAITGVSAVCTGLTTSLSDLTAAGVWSSSNTAVATIGTTKIVTGITPGTTTISYSLATGCYKTTTVTVNQSPAVITGVSPVCIGATISLSNAITGGAWSSSSVADATVGSATGIVTGVAGTTYPVITYLLADGCKVTNTITVNPLPAAITGTASVCSGLTTTLADVTAGGTWSSSNAVVATIGTTRIVTGITAGTTTISYSLATSCYKTTTVTVNQSPAAITGANAVCVSATITLSNATAGGTWTSSSTADATVIDTTGLVKGILGATSPTITYNGANGCKITEVITVNANPTAILGVTSECAGTTIILSDAKAGGTWSSTGNVSVATTGSNSGTVTAGVTAGTGMITYSFANSCYATTANTTNPNPAAIQGTFTVCAGVVTTLTDATTGTPTWSSSNVTVATVSGANVTGRTGGTSTITYKMTSGCYAIQIVTVTPAPAAITGASILCSNATTTLSDASANALWTNTWTSSNNSVASVGATTGLVSGASHGTAIITFNTGCGANVTHVVTVNQAPAAINGNNSVCAGLTTSLSNINAGGTWSSSSTSIATVSPATGIVTGVAAGTSTITYTATGCFVTSTEIINGLPTAVTVSGGGAICNSTTLAASNGGSGTIYYQGTTAGGTSTSAPSVSEVENTSGIYYFNAKSSEGCWGTQGSASVTVNTSTSISNATNLCAGGTITLSDAATGGVWSSSNAAIATIGSNTGMVTGVDEGTSTITYSLGGGICYSSVIVTVNSSPTVTVSTLSSITKGIGITPLHFHTTGAPSRYNIAWCSSAHTAGFTDVTASPLDTLSQDTVLYVSVPSNAEAAAYTGTLSVTSTGCISRGAPIKAIINDSLNIYTYAGTGMSGYSGDSGAATIAHISHPSSVVSDCNGNTYIADYDNGVVRKVDARGIITTFAGNGTIGYSGDGGPATSAQLSNPTGVVIDGNGNVYISDYNNMVVRMVNTAGVISTFAGNGGHGYSGDGGDAKSAELNYPVGLAVDNANNIYIADYLNSVIRKVNTSGIITTVAGNGMTGYSGDGGEAFDATLNNPRGVAVDGSGNMYIADYGNNVIRKVNTSGMISTFAGIGIAGYSGDGGEAAFAQLNSPWGIAVDGYNNVYFSELHNNVIRKVDSMGMINTIAGSSCACDGYSGDGSEATNAKLDQPMGISINCSGNLYIADNANFAVRVLGAYNRVPYFINGATQSLNVAQTSPTVSLNSLLAVNDFDTLQTETWSIASNASNGTLSISYSTGSTGNTLIPTGLSYTPAPGYTGNDQFTIQVSDGIATASTTIYVTVSQTAARMANGTGANNTSANEISLQLFPNPSRGNFNIQTSGVGTFYLLSMEGQSVGEYAVTGEQTEITMPSGLPSGIYIGRFKDADGNTTDVKLVYEQ